MTTIKATCAECGEVQLAPYDLRVTSNQARTSGWYEFTCPRCARTVSKPADARALRLLANGGVRVDVAPRYDAPAFTADDVIDLHHLLAAPGWFDRLAAGGAA